MPVKILSISSVYPNAEEPGLGLFVRSRLHHIAAQADVKVVAPVPAVDYSNPKRQWFHAWRLASRRTDEKLEVMQPRWFYPPGGTPLNVLCLFVRLLPMLWRLRKSYRFEVIDAHFGYPEGVTAALLARAFRCRFTITLRGSEPVFSRSRYRAACLKWAMRRADIVFAVSGQLRRFALDCGVDPARAHTSPNGVDRAVFHPGNRAASRAKFGMSAGRRVVACAGELIEAKGHHMVIAAIKALSEEGRMVDLYIAGGVSRGGAPFEAELRRQISESNLAGTVHLTGWLDRQGLAELMSAADVFCLASYIEGWPNVVNEALACGTPVVATRVGAVPDMLPDEHYGIIVEPRNQNQLTVALRHAVEQDWDRNAIAAWGQLRAWEDVAREVVEIMSTLVAPGEDGVGASGVAGAALGDRA